MKIVSPVVTVIAILSVLTALSQTKGYINPAAAYVERMGCTYETRIDKNGNSKGVCILPNDSVVDAWDFFHGKVATGYSYCEKMGYKTEYSRVDRNGFVSECAICNQQLKSNQETKIPMTELMERNGEPLISLRQKKSTNLIYENASPSNLKQAVLIPDSFDWRNYNGHSYIGGIRDQGGCGACYAFGANAAAEGVYNFANGRYDANCIDLSESFMVWCLSEISAYSDHFDGCDGSDYDYMELQALCDSGVCYESSFPYQGNDPGSCTHWNDQRIKMKSWHRIECSDTTSIKIAIMTTGVVDAAILTTSSFDNYIKGIYSDSNNSCDSTPCYYTDTDHAISLVGWGHDIKYGLYWILRNSWGAGWGENGYMRIKWDAARVACEVAYVEYSTNEVTTPPKTVTVSNDTVKSGESTCYNATDTINVAGYGTTVEFVSGSTVNLIAGKVISILPGFHAYEGSYMNASITIDSTFCNSLSSSLAEVTYEKNNSATGKTSYKTTPVNNEKRIMVYPNPTFGTFTLQLAGYESKTDIYLFNMMGKVIYHTSSIDTDNLPITLPAIPGGIYTVRVSDRKTVKTTKINLIN